MALARQLPEARAAGCDESCGGVHVREPPPDG